MAWKQLERLALRFSQRLLDFLTEREILTRDKPNVTEAKERRDTHAASPLVRSAQHMFGLPTTGFLDEATPRAIRAWQFAYDLPVSGEADEITQRVVLEHVARETDGRRKSIDVKGEIEAQRRIVLLTATEDEKKVHADWIRDAVAKGHSIRLLGARIIGKLQLKGLTIESHFSLIHCDFEDFADFSYVNARNKFELSEGIFWSGASFDGTRIDSDVEIFRS